MRATALSRALLLLTLALALGLSACAELRWHKSGEDDAALTQDLATCRKQVQDKFGGAGRLGPTMTDPRFGPMGPSQGDLQMQESQAVGMCMRGKGYSLISP